MNSSLREWLNRAAFALICGSAAWQLGLLFFAVTSRLAYPFDLEWMEGGLLDHAARLQEGVGIYGAPSVEFIPYLYTPLYPSLLAMLGEVFGLSYTLGRLLSLFALLTSLLVVVIATQTPHKRPSLRHALCGVLACGLIAAAYPWLEGWYDLVRGDTVFIAMVLVGLLLLSRWHGETGRRGQARIAAVAALLALSFFCKQIGVLFVAAGGINLLLWRRWRLIPTYVAVAGAIGLGGTLILNAVSDGWFWTYVFEIHQGHDFNWDRFSLSFSHMLKRSISATAIVGIALVAIAARLASRRKLPPEAGCFLFWLVPYATAVVAGAIGWATQWAHFNAYMSAIFLGATCVATALVCIRALACAWFPKLGTWLALALPIALAAELVSQRWQPQTFIPSARDVAAGHRLIELIRNIDGEVMVPFHPWYARLAGKETTVHRMGLMDVRLERAHKVRGMAEAFSGKRFAAVIMDNRPIRFELAELKRNYRKNAIIPGNSRPRVFTGAKVVPETVWIPLGPPPPPPPRARVLFDFDSKDGYKHWQTSGTAWGSEPRRHGQDRGRKLAVGFTGMRYARSSHGGANAVGELISPTFIIDGTRITAQIGGAKSEQLTAELRVEGEAVQTIHPTGNRSMQRVEWKVDTVRGKRATIALVDNDSGAGKELLADAIWIWD